MDANPDVFNHNVETVPSLYKEVSPGANYQHSLRLLRSAKEINPEVFTKSGIMLGLGETEEEIIATMYDLRNVGVSVLTMGQYLQPSIKHLPVVEFIEPKQFQKLKEIGLEIGFRFVESGPLVRSSYHAEKHLF